MRKSLIRYISSHAFLILDVSGKLFTLFFAALTNHYLDKLFFSEVSYFRTTLVMVVGLISNALGYYILNYYSEFKSSPCKFERFWGLILVIPVIGLSTYFLLVQIFPAYFNFKNTSAVPNLILILIFIFATPAQIVVFLLKVLDVGWRGVVCNLILTSLSLVVLTLGLAFSYPGIPYYTMILYYAFSVFLGFLIIFKSDDYQIIKGAIINVKLSATDGFRSFYLPNLLESFISVPIAWIAITICMKNSGPETIGELLLLQMILGLFVFFCNSIVLNFYTSIPLGNTDQRSRAFYFLEHKVNVISFILILFVVFLWSELHRLLKIVHMSDMEIILMIVGAIIQASLIPLGIIFKRERLSKLTLIHNIVYGSVFVLSELFFIKISYAYSYAAAFTFAWVLVLLLMIMQTHVYKLVHLKYFVVRLLSLIIFLFFSYYLFVR